MCDHFERAHSVIIVYEAFLLRLSRRERECVVTERCDENEDEANLSLGPKIKAIPWGRVSFARRRLFRRVVGELATCPRSSNDREDRACLCESCAIIVVVFLYESNLFLDSFLENSLKYLGTDWRISSFLRRIVRCNYFCIGVEETCFAFVEYIFFFFIKEWFDIRPKKRKIRRQQSDNKFDKVSYLVIHFLSSQFFFNEKCLKFFTCPIFFNFYYKKLIPIFV